MNLDKHFGAAYDVVKRSLLGWLAGLGSWCAHPMFTHDVTEDAADRFGRLLGVEIISRERLHVGTDRETYLSVCNQRRNVFLDPDTGLKLDRGKSPKYLFTDELVRLAEARPEFLTLTFDQSLQRGNEENQVRSKLEHLSARGICGLGYVSQVAFILVGKDGPLVKKAYLAITGQSDLPVSRFVVTTPSNPALHPTDAGLLVSGR